MTTAWAFDPALDDRAAEIDWQMRELTPDSPLTDKFKALANLVPTLARMTHLEEADLLESLRVRLQLKKGDLAVLKADLKAARKVRETKAKKKSESLEVQDLEEGFRLHPAIDFLGDFMTIGFRVDLPDNDVGLLMVISDGEGVRVDVAPATVEVEGQTYQVKRGAPPFLRDVWGLDRLKAFMAHPTYPKSFYDDLKAAYKTFLDLPEPAYGLLAAWTVGTYYAHLFTAYPFLHFHGPKESGKSKTLEAMRCTCFNAWKGRDITSAALGDTADGLRGTLLLDQAEKLNTEKETGNLIGLLADSYKKAGGQRRVVEMTKSGRSVLEFSTYGPKAFASTKPLDPDLADRCVKVPMTRTRRQLPDLEGWEPVWSDLRDKLYRFTLAAFKDVQAHYEAIPGNGTRIGELWRPMQAMLLALGVGEEEIEAIRTLFMEATKETRHEPTGWECTLLEVLREEAQVHDDKFEMTVTDILKAMNIEGDKQPGGKWLGDSLSRYNLSQGRRRVKVKVAGKDSKITAYQFDPARVKELCEIYLRDTPPDDLSHLSHGDNTNDSNGFDGTQEKPGTCPYPSPCDLTESMGHEGSCPLEIACPFYHSENAGENSRGHKGQEESGGIPEKNFNFLSGEEVEL